MLSFAMLSVVMPRVFILGDVIHSFAMLSVVMPRVLILGDVIQGFVMLIVVILSVLAPIKECQLTSNMPHYKMSHRLLPCWVWLC